MSTAETTHGSHLEMEQVGKHRTFHLLHLTVQEMRPNPEDASPDTYEQLPVPLDTREPLVEAHSNLSKISRLARHCYDRMVDYRSMYEQAYVIEQAKLAQSVTVCRGLETEIARLNEENSYYQQQLVPDYERMISSLTAQHKDSEARLRAHEEKSCVELEERRKATEAMIELLAASNERMEALEKLHQSAIPDTPIVVHPRHRGGVKRQAAATSEQAGPLMQHTRSKANSKRSKRN
jgi:cell division septum initiation protein DivIVA